MLKRLGLFDHNPKSLKQDRRVWIWASGVGGGDEERVLVVGGEQIAMARRKGKNVV